MDTMHRLFRGEATYQAETDMHFPQLTVGQTLLFAALARTPKNRFPGVTRKRYAEHIRDVAMAVFGISHTVNTKVGDDFVRGVSGGERKRVSIAEVTLKHSPVQCWDNSTRGLDSATALEFVKTLRLSTDLAGVSAVVAMYQAPEPAYEVSIVVNGSSPPSSSFHAIPSDKPANIRSQIFDKVAVLYEGRQIFFGSRSDTKRYFIKMGYRCPNRQTTPDFLTSITNPAERLVEPGFELRVPRTPDEFALAWRNSPERAQLLEDIASFEEQHPQAGLQREKFLAARKAERSNQRSPKSSYMLSTWRQIALCMRRGYQRLLGDKLFFIVTIGGNFIISVVLGSVFYRLPDNASSVNSRSVLLFFAILFNAMSSSLEVRSPPLQVSHHVD
jgi:ATP-binding cassette, subfamily G (WHITE), member 2, PDR